MISRIIGSSGTQSNNRDIESGNHGQLPDHNDQQSEQNSQRSRGSDRPPDINNQESDNNGLRKAGDANTSKIVIVRDDDDVAPNVSLNHIRHSHNEIILVAALGVLIQSGVLFYCGFATRNSFLRHHLLNKGQPVQNYAFPLTVSGTIVLTMGVFICGFVVERSTDESYYKANDNYDAYLIWLQKDGTISDPVFKPCAIWPTSERTLITASRRKRCMQISDLAQKPRQGHAAAMTELKLLTTVGCLVSIFGFVLQFTGLREMNFTASIAQFVATAIMTILRALHGRKRL